MASSVSCRRCGAYSLSGGRSCSRCGKPLLVYPFVAGTDSAPARWPGATSSVETEAAFGARVPGTIIRGRFQIQRKLGEGGMGAVYLVRDLNLAGRACALKELTCHRGTESEQQAALRRFAAEAETLATLSHPGIPQVYDRFTENGRYYILMEYVAGLDLLTVLTRHSEQWGTPLPEAAVIGHAVQLCEILAYLHGHRPPVVHGDLKPTNMILVRSGRIKLVDFGVARPVETSRRSLFGTVGYAAPEQYRGQVSPLSDLYALGVCLFHLLTGLDPQEAPPDFRALHRPDSSLSPAVVGLLESLVALDPSHRPPSAEAVGELLRTELRNLGTEQREAARWRVEAIVARGLWETSEKAPCQSAKDGRPNLSTADGRSDRVEADRHSEQYVLDRERPMHGSGESQPCGVDQTPPAATLVAHGEPPDLLLRVPPFWASAGPAQPVTLVSATSGTRARGLILTRLSGREWDYVFVARDPGAGTGESSLVGAPVEAYRYVNSPHGPMLQALPPNAYLESAEVVRCWRAWLKRLAPVP